MTEDTDSQAFSQRQHFPSGILPQNPALALLAGLLFKQLGGVLVRDKTGPVRLLPEPPASDGNIETLPQMPDAKPHERFHTVDEWQGALKVADYLLVRLDAADKELMFELLAPFSSIPSEPFDFREQLR